MMCRFCTFNCPLQPAHIKLTGGFLIIESPVSVLAPCGFFSVDRCVYWEAAHKFSLTLDKNFLSEAKYKKLCAGAYLPVQPAQNATRFITSETKSFCLKLMRFSVLQPHT